MEKRTGKIHESDLDYRSKLPKVRGGWTKDKIKKELKKLSSDASMASFYREIAKFDSPSQFKKNLYYHGSGKSISALKPSIVLKDTESFGGGYGEKYWGISLSKDRNIASNFTGQSNFGSVAPVVLKRNAKIKQTMHMMDAVEIEDIVEELWDEGIDAVIIGDHSKPDSEQEIVILNPKCIAVGESVYFRVFDKPKMPSFDDDKILALWLESSTRYKEEIIRDWEERNERFEKKWERSMNPSTQWNTKQEDLKLYHENNIKRFMDESDSMSPKLLGEKKETLLPPNPDMAEDAGADVEKSEYEGLKEYYRAKKLRDSKKEKEMLLQKNNEMEFDDPNSSLSPKNCS